MKVYYGWTRKNKISKRDALTVIFINEKTPPRINKDGKDGVTQKMYVAYEREQTKNEEQDSRLSNRIYTVFYIFMDDKKINNSLTKALQENYDADKNNVSKEEREMIRQALKDKYLHLNPHYKEKNYLQLELPLFD